ncbi:MAG: aldo/keto reductase [Acidobacteriota bacterium]
MQHRTIGSLSVSVVGLGCNNFGWHLEEAPSRRVIGAALDAGINHFDTADIYGDGASEEMLGRALGGRRDEVIIASKCGHRRSGGGGSAEHVERSCEASLRRLGTDRIDLFYLHQPDPSTPITETLEALGRLHAAGKVREIACSNFSPEQLREAATVASDVRFVAVQNEYSLLHRQPEDGVLDACRALDIAFVPYFPLKSGLLTGKYRRGDLPEDGRLSGREGSFFAGMGDRLLTNDHLDLVERLAAFAEDRGHTLLDLAFSWLLASDVVASVIAGATKPEQIHANVRATDWRLDDGDLAELDRRLGEV